MFNSKKNPPTANMSSPEIITSLQKSCQSMQKINNNLSTSAHSIELHTKDIPRIDQVLKNSQFFELVSVSEIRAAQYQLNSELEPQFKELVKLCENGLLQLQKREQMLRNNIAKKRNNSQNQNNKLDGLNDVMYSSTKTVNKSIKTSEINDSDDEDENSLKASEQLIKNLRSKKNLLLVELEKLDQELIKKQSLLKALS